MARKTSSPAVADPAASFWARVRVPRFREPAPRVLLFTSGYFLQREIAGACARLGWPLCELPVPPGDRGSSGFVEALLAAVATFRPDFALTVNHIGLDSRGVLLDLFGRMALPLASWFVDSPRLILHDFPNQTTPWCAPFTWDADTVEPLAAMGFDHVLHLPLATDTALFAPGAPADAAWAGGVSFVGDSMQRPSALLESRLAAYPRARDLCRAAAPAFAASRARTAERFLLEESPGLLEAWRAMPARTRLDLEQYLTWQATRDYRLECVRELLPFDPLIAGDDGWRDLLPEGGWRHAGRVDYYAGLPGFYGAATVNFNATSMQMKGAVNQRVFDVPACGGFLLTDAREQLAALLEPGREVACYAHPGEIADRARHALAHPTERAAVATAGRARVLAEHDYTHRMRTMVRALRRRYA